MHRARSCQHCGGTSSVGCVLGQQCPSPHGPEPRGLWHALQTRDTPRPSPGAGMARLVRLCPEQQPPSLGTQTPRRDSQRAAVPRRLWALRLPTSSQARRMPALSPGQPWLMAPDSRSPWEPYLHERILLRRAAAGLLHELAVDLALQLGVNQADLQGPLGQGRVVVHRGGFHGHIDEELAGLAGKRQRAQAARRPRSALRDDGQTGPTPQGPGRLWTTAENVSKGEHCYCWRASCLLRRLLRDTILPSLKVSITLAGQSFFFFFFKDETIQTGTKNILK